MEEPGDQKKEIQHGPKVKADQTAFLAAYASTGTIVHSAKAVGITPARHYEWLEEEDYKRRFHEAREEAIETLEAEARRRAYEGVEEPVGWYKGNPGGYAKRYSDTLLIFLLKGLRPEVYRERFEHSGPQGVPLGVRIELVQPKGD